MAVGRSQSPEPFSSYRGGSATNFGDGWRSLLRGGAQRVSGRRGTSVCAQNSQGCPPFILPTRGPWGAACGSSESVSQWSNVVGEGLERFPVARRCSETWLERMGQLLSLGTLLISEACPAASPAGARRCSRRGTNWGCLRGCLSRGEALGARRGRGVVGMLGDRGCPEMRVSMAWRLLGSLSLGGLVPEGARGGYKDIQGVWATS